MIRSGSALARLAELGHERLIVVQDRATGLRAAIALHDSTLGPAVGGTRMRAYPDFEAAVADALELSRAMTLKVVYAGLPHGGAKAVIDADPARADKPALLAAFARATVELAGRFVSAGDAGVDARDVELLGSLSPVYARPRGEAAPDVAEATALGVFASLRVVARRLGRGLGELRVAIQGVGEIGARLAERLAAHGSTLLVADTDGARAHRVARATGARVVAPEELVAAPCDVLSPNAIGGTIDERALERLRCAAICGAANLPLASAAVGDELHRRGILYAPDFVVSAGGVLTLLFERGELDLAGTLARVERIGVDLAELLAAAELERTPPFRLAERRVDATLDAARRAIRV